MGDLHPEAGRLHLPGDPDGDGAGPTQIPLRRDAGRLPAHHPPGAGGGRSGQEEEGQSTGPLAQLPGQNGGRDPGGLPGAPADSAGLCEPHGPDGGQNCGFDIATKAAATGGRLAITVRGCFVK